MMFGGDENDDFLIRFDDVSHQMQERCHFVFMPRVKERKLQVFREAAFYIETDQLRVPKSCFREFEDFVWKRRGK